MHSALVDSSCTWKMPHSITGGRFLFCFRNTVSHIFFVSLPSMQWFQRGIFSQLKLIQVIETKSDVDSRFMNTVTLANELFECCFICKYSSASCMKILLLAAIEWFSICCVFINTSIKDNEPKNWQCPLLFAIIHKIVPFEYHHQQIKNLDLCFRVVCKSSSPCLKSWEWAVCV